MLVLWISLLAAFGLLFCGSILGIILCLAAAFLISIILLFKGKVLAGLSGLFAGALTTALIAVLGVLLVPVVIISAITEQKPDFKQEVQELLSDQQELQAYLAKNLPALNAALQEKNACTPATPCVPATPSTPSAPASKITPEQETATPEAVAEKAEVTTSASPQNEPEELTFDRIVTPQKADTPSQDQDSDDDKDTASEDQNDGDDDDNSDDLDDEK